MKIHMDWTVWGLFCQEAAGNCGSSSTSHRLGCSQGCPWTALITGTYAQVQNREEVTGVTLGTWNLFLFLKAPQLTGLGKLTFCFTCRKVVYFQKYLQAVVVPQYFGKIRFKKDYQ